MTTYGISSRRKIIMFLSVVLITSSVTLARESAVQKLFKRKSSSSCLHIYIKGKYFLLRSLTDCSCFKNLTFFTKIDQSLVHADFSQTLIWIHNDNCQTFIYSVSICYRGLQTTSVECDLSIANSANINRILTVQQLNMVYLRMQYWDPCILIFR